MDLKDLNKKSSNLKGLEGFSEETLNEMSMESIEGGEDGNICPNVPCKDDGCTNYC